MGGRPGGDIDNGEADARRCLRAAGDRGKAALGLNQKVIGLALGIGTSSP
jgi:hypothetical protein